jgi:hypothetical protein
MYMIIVLSVSSLDITEILRFEINDFTKIIILVSFLLFHN